MPERGIELSETNTVQRIPSPVVVELSYGAEFGDEDERRNVGKALRMYPVVEQDETMEETSRRLIGGPRPEDVAGILSSEAATAMRDRFEGAHETDTEAKHELRERFE